MPVVAVRDTLEERKPAGAARTSDEFNRASGESAGNVWKGRNPEVAARRDGVR
jgi:hypothetical protein